MKYIYSIHIIFIVVFGFNQLNAQDYKHSLEGITKVVIRADNNVQVFSHEQSELLITERDNDRNKTPEKAKGLLSLFAKGNDNTGYGVEIKQKDSELLVTSLLDERAFATIIYLPKTMNIYVESFDRSNITVEGFESEIEAKNVRGNIFLTDLTGPIVAENVTGNVVVVFSEISQESPTSIVVEKGDIDIKMSKNSNVNLSSKMIHGQFYTDFEIDKLSKKESDLRSITGKINKGGVEIFLRSLNGDIYLRKEK